MNSLSKIENEEKYQSIKKEAENTLEYVDFLGKENFPELSHQNIELKKNPPLSLINFTLKLSPEFKVEGCSQILARISNHY